jgi:hypothetical protein
MAAWWGAWKMGQHSEGGYEGVRPWKAVRWRPLRGPPYSYAHGDVLTDREGVWLHACMCMCVCECIKEVVRCVLTGI